MSTTTYDPLVRSRIAWLVRVPIDPMTYRALAFLLISMPLSILYTVVLTTGFATSIGLSVLLIGPLVLGGTLLVSIGLAWLDGALAEVLLGANVDRTFPSRESLRSFLFDLFLGRETWFAVVYLLWKTVLGGLAFFVVLMTLPPAIGFLLSPFYYGETIVIYWIGGPISVDSLSYAVALSGFGVIVGYLGLLAINGLGLVSHAIAEALLQGPSSE